MAESKFNLPLHRQSIVQNQYDSDDSGNGDEAVIKPKVKWAIPQRLDSMAFVGKEVLMVAQDLYIIFIHLKTGAETVYIANNKSKGDGVDVISGSKGGMFAFTEKVINPRIFVMTYPLFVKMALLKDEDVNRYKGLCLMEQDMVAGFSGFPNYILSVWSWRSRQRLLSVPTGVLRRNQIFMASRSHPLICQCWGEGLTVWEVAQCYKKCLIMKRVKHETTGWELPDPPLVDVCWGNDNTLYAIDDQAKLYSVASDGIGMVPTLEWEGGMSGSYPPSVCTFQSGLLIYGPDNVLRMLSKGEAKWVVTWSYVLGEPMARLAVNSTADVGVMWTRQGCLYKITADSEDKVDLKLFTYKQRNITKVQLIAPSYKYIAVINDSSLLSIYEINTAKLIALKQIKGEDIFVQTSPVEPVLAISGLVGKNYGLTLQSWSEDQDLMPNCQVCLTHQIVSRIVFSPTGRELIAAAMAAGHIFIYSVSSSLQLSLVRYTEVGRGLADVLLTPVGDHMRALAVVLFHEHYLIGERIVCINAVTGKDNKFAGKMAGPYHQLLPLSTPSTILAVPHRSKDYHVLKLSGDFRKTLQSLQRWKLQDGLLYLTSTQQKGITVTVKMGPIIYTGHDIKQYGVFFNMGCLLTYGYDGTVVKRDPTGPEAYDFKLIVTHRYESGINQALTDEDVNILVHLAANKMLVVQALDSTRTTDVKHQPLNPKSLEPGSVEIIQENAKNYLDLQEDKKVYEEAMDFKKQREEVVTNFKAIQAKVVELLEENLAEIPLHQLSLSEFNLHMENKKERLRRAEREREIIRLETEARIKAQDKVTQWIKKNCWDTMLTQRVKLFAIFSHYQVENYAVLPTQRSSWPELQHIEALRALEQEMLPAPFTPWVPQTTQRPSDSQLEVLRSIRSIRSGRTIQSSKSSVNDAGDADSFNEIVYPHVLAGSRAHEFVSIPSYMVPQTMAFSFLQMNWLYHIIRLNVQNMRLWFNKQFDELMAQKKREVGLVAERNARFRFIVEELNKLSDLRGSFHHLVMHIEDPQWRQEEQPERLIKVEPDECSIEPYISPSQIVPPPPELKPKDDFKERALMDMMDGVLEKLWHEEIKKPIPMPQCMLEKDPEHFNEEDLRMVFEYEAKVKFREDERDKYRKMLHAEYGKLALVFNEGIVKFNMKVKDMWLTKLKVDSVIGQENLNLMRLRRTNLDRLEAAEEMENIRDRINTLEQNLDKLSQELKMAQDQHAGAGAQYEALTQRDKLLDRAFRNHFPDLSPIIVDQCYKFFKKRPKWVSRSSMTAGVLYELAGAILTGVRPPQLHVDCVDYFKAVEVSDNISNMPPVMDEGLWATMCKLRRVKIDNEIKLRAAGLELGGADGAVGSWSRAAAQHRALLQDLALHRADLRTRTEASSRNNTIQVVLPAGQVEISATGHMEDFEDATLILREDIEKINELILKVGEMKLRMMRKQMEFRKGILAKEWEHAAARMKLRHLQQELYSYRRLKIPKELQLYLKNKELGYTEEMEYTRMEKEIQASRTSINKLLEERMNLCEEIQLKVNAVELETNGLEKMISALNLKVSEKRLNEDQLEPIRIRRQLKKRMETLVMRGSLIRQVQSNHTTLVLLQTELELLRLKTYPTLAPFKTLC